MMLTAVMSPIGSWLPALILVTATIFFSVILTISIRSKIARRNAQRLDPREHIRQIRAAANPHVDLHAATASYLETTQRLAAQLDNKSERLEQLLLQADERIASLRALECAGTAASSTQPASTNPSPRPLDPLTRSVYDLADADNSPVEIAQQLHEQVGKVELILALRGRGDRIAGEGDGSTPSAPA